MIAIVPGYISRSVAGSYDNEAIAIFCMLFTYYLWIKAVKTGSLFWGTLCSLAYFYMVRSLPAVRQCYPASQGRVIYMYQAFVASCQWQLASLGNRQLGLISPKFYCTMFNSSAPDVTAALHVFSHHFVCVPR